MNMKTCEPVIKKKVGGTVVSLVGGKWLSSQGGTYGVVSFLCQSQRITEQSWVFMSSCEGRKHFPLCVLLCLVMQHVYKNVFG